MGQMQITLPTALRKRMDHLVKIGLYESGAEVVRDGLRRLFESQGLDRPVAIPPAHHADVIDIREQQATKPKPKPAVVEDDDPPPPMPTAEELARKEEWESARRKWVFDEKMEEMRRNMKPDPTKAEMDAATEEARAVYAQLAKKHWPIPSEVKDKWREKYRIGYLDVIEMEFQPPAGTDA